MAHRQQQQQHYHDQDLDRDDNDYEWDESKTTVTAWSIATKLRAKQTYGKRSSSSTSSTTTSKTSFTVLKEDPDLITTAEAEEEAETSNSTFTRNANDSANNTETTAANSRDYTGTISNSSNNSKTGNATSNQTYGRRKVFRSKSMLTGGTHSGGDDYNNNNSNNNNNNTTTIEPNKQTRKSITKRRNGARRSLSMGAFTLEENIHPNTAATTTATTPHTSSQDSLSFSKHSGGTDFASICRKRFGSHESYSSSSSNFLIAPCLTPSRSVSSSSKKRGVCDSPLFNTSSTTGGGGDDDLSSYGGGGGGGFSSGNINHSTTSSFGSRRARSRIFSPESTKKLIMEEEAARVAAVMTSSVSFPTFDDRGGDIKNTSKMSTIAAAAAWKFGTIRKKASFQESESEMEIDLEENDNSMSFQNTSCEMSHADLDDLRTDIVGLEAVEGTTLTKTRSRLKMLCLPLRSLRPRRMSSIGDMSFDETIFAPVEKSIIKSVFETMSSYEDLKFLLKELRKWSGGKLLASFGMSKNCTVVTPNSWSTRRRLAFVDWTTTHLGFCQKSCGGGVNYVQIGASKAKDVQNDLEKALLKYKESKRKNKNANFTEKRDIGVNIKNHQTPLPISSIKISRIEYTPLTVESAYAVGHHVDENDYVVDDLAGNLNALDLKPKLESTPLARMVTLPDDASTSKVIKPGRLSHDNSVLDTREFVSHMYGISPRIRVSNKVHRPTLAMPNRQYSGGKNTMDIFSPALPVITASLSFDQAETPGVNKLTNRRWGSRPVPGKDWGQSEKCSSNVIGILRQQFEEASKYIGSLTCPTFPASNASPLYVRPGMSGVRADSKSLGIIESDAENSFVAEPLIDSNEEEEGTDWGNDKDYDTFPIDDFPTPSGDLHDPISLLNVQEDNLCNERIHKRRVQSFAKHSRMSICYSAMDSRAKPFRPSVLQQRTSFAYDFDQLRISSPLKVKRKEPILLHETDVSHSILMNSEKLLPIMSFFTEYELQCQVSLVCSTWANIATESLANLMLISVGCTLNGAENESDNAAADDDDESTGSDGIILTDGYDQHCSVAKSMHRQWDYLLDRFPWGCFLSEGTFKRVFRVWNPAVKAEEAISVMDVSQIDDKNIVGNELAVSVMLSSLARRHICPNFVKMRGVFTASYAPPKSLWGCAENRNPNGNCYHQSRGRRRPREPSDEHQGQFQYIRMELCKYGDVEEFIKEQPNAIIDPEEARQLLFQMAYSLHVAGDKFGMKHYDVKLLNFFLQSANDSDVSVEEFPTTTLRYGLGSHVFNLRMPTSRALLAKLADFGTANTRPESNGQPVMLNNFTTLENTPPDFMILGDAAQQGYGHDCFGLGMCMLHLFTGEAPYEELMENIKCPPNLKKKLKRVWESKQSRISNNYSVIQSVITLDLWEDDEGNVEGEIDETLYDTFYRFLVLFGIPEHKFHIKEGSKVWNAIASSLELDVEDSPMKVRRSKRNNSNREKKGGRDVLQFQTDCEQFSIRLGKDPRIVRARENLERFEGGINLLLSLVSFDPHTRASPLDVINSNFMSTLREESVTRTFAANEKVYSYMSYFAGNC